MTEKIIACCKCGNVPDYTRKAFHLVFKGEMLPKICVGREEIRNFAEKLSPNKNITKYLNALAKSKEKYSYYFEYDEKGNITDQHNLLTGRKIA